MRKLIFASLAISVMFLANFALAKIDNSAKYYQIYLEKQDDQVVKKGVVVRAGSKEVSVEQKSAVATLYSFNNEELISTTFDLPLDGASTSLELPYYELGEEIIILKTTGEEVLRVNVAAFAKTCDDGICQNHESYYTCKEDCPSGIADGFCDTIQDNICDKDCLPESLDPDYPDCLGKAPERIDNINTDTTNQLNIVERNDAVNNQTEQLTRVEDDVNNQKKPFLAIVIGLIVLVLIVVVILVVKNMNKEDQY
jgi:hypothetical protein